jgi:predicted benzoate:H+ symporter BenE
MTATVQDQVQIDFAWATPSLAMLIKSLAESSTGVR